MSVTRIFKPAILTAILVLAGITSASAANYNVDTAHGYVEFKISHIGISLLGGRFNKYAGSLSWDKENPSSSSIEVTVDTTSVDTNHEQRDQHISGADFLNVAKFPTATFKSTAYHGDASGGHLMGDLTLNGVTKNITIDIKVTGEGKDPWGGYRAGFSGTASINGKDFGYANAMLHQPIEISLSVEGIQQK